jgi:hypothetical protein
MTDKADPHHEGELVELGEKMKPVPTQADVVGAQDESLSRTQTTMNKTKWLACIALCFSYTTAFQQNSCTAAIVKHIDTELG